ncbi:MAG: hypothetical protein MZU97_15555 [Bacillus subtilis]|nr:hypothetical protein [Bacillus subtilis]
MGLNMAYSSTKSEHRRRRSPGRPWSSPARFQAIRAATRKRLIEQYGGTVSVLRFQEDRLSSSRAKPRGSKLDKGKANSASRSSTRKNFNIACIVEVASI